jgi:hypothetical protein
MVGSDCMFGLNLAFMPLAACNFARPFVIDGAALPSAVSIWLAFRATPGIPFMK